jgi:fermentation-respiration switch protein FrsA (DUF1100 family)
VGLWTRLERLFVFFPASELPYTPDQLGLEFEDVYFTTEDGLKLNGWFVPGASDTTLLWFHGNAGNIGHRVEEMALFHRRLGVNLFIFDYRGYGRSEGKPSEQGIYRDARAALHYLEGRADVVPDKIIYFGRSLGAAVAVELAVARPPLALVLVAPFTSLGDMAQVAYPHLPLRWLLEDRYNSLALLPRIHRPLLIMHGDQDKIVPLSQSERLLQAANSPKHLQVLPGAGHNDTYFAAGNVYWDTLREFLEPLSKQMGH